MKIPLYETDKKLALGFSFWNNTPGEITRALDPWADKVDYIIAVDGRYRVPYSPEMLKQPELIRSRFSTNTNTIRTLETNYHDKLILLQHYGDQMAKRQKYLDKAAKLGCAAVIVWDTDEMIIEGPQGEGKLNIQPNWNRFYKLIALAHEFAEGEAASLDMWCWIPDEELWPRQHNIEESNKWRKYQRVHLNPGKQRYILNHYTFAYKDVTEHQMLEFSTNEENTTKWNPYMIYPMGIAEGIRFTTDRKLRSQEVNNYGDAQAWQLIQEETYRAKMVEFQVRGMDDVYKQLYRFPYTYYFDSKGKPVDYTKKEEDLFNSLEL